MDVQALLASGLVGFGCAILAMPLQTMVANSKAMKTVSAVYKDLLEEVRKEVRALRNEVDKLKPLRCDNMGCKNRRPPSLDNKQTPEKDENSN